MKRQNYQEVPNIEYDDFIKGGKYKVINPIEKGFIEDYSENEDFEKKYLANVYRYSYSGEEPFWDKLHIKIEDIHTGKVIVEFYTNYHSFFGIYVQQNNQDFLISRGDYQGYLIANLTTGVVKTYIDPEDVAMGCGFCPCDYEWDPWEDELTVSGCVWACPYEYGIIYIPDLNNPIESINKACYGIYEPDDDWFEEEDEEEWS